MDIYPRNYIFAHRQTKNNTSFVLMPFTDDLILIYQYVKEVLENMGIDCNRADSVFESKAILATIIEQILSSEFIIADLTHKNANVFYEVGLSHIYRDCDNVILIAQKMDDVPFDLRHLPILIYNMSSITELKRGIQNRINNARSQNRAKNYILHYFSNMKFSSMFVEETINRLKESYPKIDENLYSILSHDRNVDQEVISLEDIQQVIDALNSGQKSENSMLNKLLRKIKLEILIKVANINIAKEYCLSVLKSNYYGAFIPVLDEEQVFSVEYASKLIELGIYKNEAINWIFGYLKNSRVGGVDIVRNKVNEFLVTSNDEDIDQELINLLQSKNHVLREASVDILSQKRSPKAFEKIKKILGSEKDIYVVRSIVTGLERYGDSSVDDIIMDWYRKNNHVIKINNAKFLCDVALEYFKKENRFDYTKEISDILFELS